MKSCANWRRLVTKENNNEADRGEKGVETDLFSPGVGAPVFSGARKANEEVPQGTKVPVAAAATLLFQAPAISHPDTSGNDDERPARKQRSRRRVEELEEEATDSSSFDDDESVGEQSQDTRDDANEEQVTTVRRRRRRRSSTEDDSSELSNEVEGVKGSTRLEAKRQRRREGRRENRRRQVVTESEFLARRESVKREMIVREKNGLNQIAVLEDGLLVEHYVARRTQQTMVGNIYLGRVQNVLPSMEAAFVDLGKGRNAVLYAGEVNWEALGFQGRPRRIEQALKSGDTVLVQVTKDPIGHKGARLTSQITLAGRFLVLVPDGQMTGISRKLPEKERARLKKLLSKIVPKDSGVIVRTAAEGATEAQLRDDVNRLQAQWDEVVQKQKKGQKAPVMLRSEPELAVRVVRDVFNEDFSSLTVQGSGTWKTISEYVSKLSPDLKGRLVHWTKREDVFHSHRVDEQLAKGMDNKVWLPSGGSLIIDRTEAMTVIDVNTGKFIGSGGTLEETVTMNNLEAAEEIVRQLRLRDIGGIIVIDFVDMVLESNRDLVLRRLVECLGRDRTRHQVTEITALGLVQMTRKRVGEGLVEAFSTPCECCEGRGFIVHSSPVEKDKSGHAIPPKKQNSEPASEPESDEKHEEVKAALSAIAASAASKHHEDEGEKQSNSKNSDRKRGQRNRKQRDDKNSVSDSTEPREGEAGEVNVLSEQDSGDDATSSKKSGSGAGHKRDSEQSREKKDGAKAANHGVATDETQPEGKRPRKASSSSQRKQVSSAPRAAKLLEEPDHSGGGAVVPRKRARRAVTMEVGHPKVKLDLPQPVKTEKIGRPAAVSLDDIQLPDASSRPAKKARRAVMSQPNAGGEENK
ncbi:Rne/Rng family ribonuclease [Actinomyces sp.]|uniref:Rne/Rng family ribonuclease n=1 Tax=Actinomyces sp. TaxID=29317 RepID=UPI00290D6FA2|nr:Rne/Rng family ribonuclease [Actinomyces sp.]MDU5231582.1 Rne/Rng family ribonuclease [Actinomyces sp.]MDU6757004.1 Rne/Rng family ribonuclease [Actinomyces sp.]